MSRVGAKGVLQAPAPYGWKIGFSKRTVRGYQKVQFYNSRIHCVTLFEYPFAKTACVDRSPYRAERRRAFDGIQSRWNLENCHVQVWSRTEWETTKTIRRPNQSTRIKFCRSPPSMSTRSWIPATISGGRIAGCIRTRWVGSLGERRNSRRPTCFPIITVTTCILLADTPCRLATIPYHEGQTSTPGAGPTVPRFPRSQ